MQRALVAGIIIALICPLIGNFLVLKKYSMVGDTLSHSAFAGVSIGLLLGANAVMAAVIFTVLCSLFLEKLRGFYKQYEEMTMAIMLTLSVGIAITIISVANLNANIQSFLFGSIITVSDSDVYIMIALGILILLIISIFYNKLLFITFDEEGAKLSGINTKTINYIFAILTGITVAVTIRITGMLVISSILVLPVASSMQISRSFKTSVIFSILFGMADVIIGLIMSYILNCAPGGAIALASVFFMLLAIAINKMFKITERN